MPGIEQNEDQPEPAKYTVELGVAARFENPWDLYAQPVQVQYARQGIRGGNAIKEEPHCECDNLSSLSESSQKRTQTDNNVEVGNVYNDTSQLNMELNLAQVASTSEQDENQTKNGLLYTFEEIASVDRKYSIDELEDTLATDNFEISTKLYPSDSNIDNVMNRDYHMASSNTSDMSMDKTLSESENSLEHLNLTSSSEDMSGINKQENIQSEIVRSLDTTLQNEPQTKPKVKGKVKGKGGSSKLTSYLKGLTKKHKATDVNQTETSKTVPENEKAENSNKTSDIENVEPSAKSVASNNISELKSNLTDLQTQTNDLLSVIGSSVDPINIDGNKFVNSVEKMSDKPDGIDDLSTEYTNPNSPSVTMDINQTATSILSTVPQYTTVSHPTVNKDNVQINTSGENIDFNVLSSSQIKSDDVITETRNKSDLNTQSDSNVEGSKKLDSFFENVKSKSKGKPRKVEKSSSSSESVNSDMDISNTLQTNTLSPNLVEFSNSESKMDDSFTFDVFSSDQTNSLESGINNMSAQHTVFDDKSLDLESQSLISPEKEKSPASVISDSGFLSQGSFIEDSKISESLSNDQLKSPSSEGNNLESIIEVSQAKSVIPDSVSSTNQISYFNDFLDNESFSLLDNGSDVPEIGLKKAVKEDSFEEDLYEVNPSIIYESTDIQDRYFDQTPLCEQPIIEEDESLISPPCNSDDLAPNETNHFQFGDDFVDITPHEQTEDNDEKDFMEVSKADENITSLKENQASWLEECVDATDMNESGKYLPDKDFSFEDSFVDIQQDDFQQDYNNTSENLDEPIADVVDERDFGNDYEIVLGNKPMKEFTVADFTNPDNQISERTLVERQLMDTALVSDHFGMDTSYKGDKTEPIEPNSETEKELLDTPNPDRIDEDSEFSKTNILENIADIEDFVTETLQNEQQSPTLLVSDEHFSPDNLNTGYLEKEHLDSEDVNNEQYSLVEKQDSEHFQENSDINDPYDEFFDEIEKTDHVTESYLALNQNNQSVEDLMTEQEQEDVLKLEETTPEDETNSNLATTENIEIQHDETISRSLTKHEEIPDDDTKLMNTGNYEIPEDQSNSKLTTTETNGSAEELTNSESGTTESHQIQEDDTKSQSFTADNFENIFVEEVVNNENQCQNELAEVKQSESLEITEGPFSEENNEEMVDLAEIQKKNMEMLMKLKDNEATLLNLQDEIIRSSELMDEPTDHQNINSEYDFVEENNVSKDVHNIIDDSVDLHQDTDSQEFHQKDQLMETSTPLPSSLPHYMRQQDVSPVKSEPTLKESLSNKNTQSKEHLKSFHTKDHESSYSEFDEDIKVEPIRNLRKMFETSRDEPVIISPIKSSPKSNKSKYLDNKTENVDIEVISSATPLEEVIQPSTSVRNMLRMWEINKKEQEEMSPRQFNKLSKKWHSCGHIYYKSDNEADSWGNGVTVSDEMAVRPSSNDSDSRQQRPNKTTETKQDGGRTVTTTTTKTETISEVKGGSRGGSSSSMKIKEDSTISTPKQNGVETSRTSQITREEVRKTEQSRNMANVATAPPPVNNQQMSNYDDDDEDEDGDAIYENVPSPARTDVFRETDGRTDLELPQLGRASSMKERFLKLAEESASGKRTADKELTPPPEIKGVIEAGVFESQPSQPRQDVYRFRDTRNEDPVPEKGKALNTVQKYKEIASREFKGPADKREITPDRAGVHEYVSEPRAEHLTYEERPLEAGIFESQPQVAENVHRYEDYVPEELPEIGFAKSIASKFKEIEKNAHMPKSPADKREVTPDRHGRGEYVSEPRAQHLTYEEKVEGGIYENQPAAVRDDIYRHEDYYTPDPVPEKGYAKNLVSRFREIEKNASVPKPSGRQITPPREDSKNVYENVPTDSPIAYKETIQYEDVLPEKGKAKNLASKYKIIEQENLKAKAGNRQVKEFTPPKDERTVFESTPRESNLRYDEASVESGILENQPTVREDIYRESDPRDIEVELPERGAAKNLLSRWKQIESESANKTPPTPGRYKEFTPPRTDERVREQRAPLSPGIQNNSVQPNDLPGQYQQAGSEPAVFESTPTAPREDLYREADTDWSQGLPKANKTKKMLSKFQSIQQKAQEPVTSSTKREEPEYTIPSIKDNKPKKGGFFVAVQNEKCGACQKTVYAMEKIEMNKNHYHRACLKCSQCSAVLTPKTFAINAGTMYCTSHYKQLFARKGNYDEGFGRPQHKKKWKSEPNLLADSELQEHEIEA